MNRYHGNGITNEQEKILDFTGGEKKNQRNTIKTGSILHKKMEEPVLTITP